MLLRLFGASIGENVRIKPGVRVKFPWRFIAGDWCWIGEDVWIDNLDTVRLENNVVLSQGSYLCTGNHDWSSMEFTLQTKPIHIESYCWIAAKSVILPGVTCAAGSVLTAGSIAGSNLEQWHIYTGNPAQKIKQRVLSSS